MSDGNDHGSRPALPMMRLAATATMAWTGFGMVAADCARVAFRQLRAPGFFLRAEAEALTVTTRWQLCRDFRAAARSLP